MDVQKSAKPIRSRSLDRDVGVGLCCQSEEVDTLRASLIDASAALAQGKLENAKAKKLVQTLREELEMLRNLQRRQHGDSDDSTAEVILLSTRKKQLEEALSLQHERHLAMLRLIEQLIVSRQRTAQVERSVFTLRLQELTSQNERLKRRSAALHRRLRTVRRASKKSSTIASDACTARPSVPLLSPEPTCFEKVCSERTESSNLRGPLPQSSCQPMVRRSPWQLLISCFRPRSNE